MFKIGEQVILNENIKNDYPSVCGELATITRVNTSSPNYQYDVVLPTGDFTPVRVSEINKLTDEQKELITYIVDGCFAIYSPTNELVSILKTDYLHGFVEVEFEDAGIQVVEMSTLKKVEKEINRVEETKKLGKFGNIGLEIGKFTDKKNDQYGSSVDATYEMIKVLMERYKNEDNSYTIPESLLQHILLQVRMMDKQNRIFNNPSGEGDSESPYRDLGGYSLIGINMTENK